MPPVLLGVMAAVAILLNASQIVTKNFSAWHLPKLQHGFGKMFERNNELLNTITSEEDNNTSQRNEK
jgi:hypothetical protein